MARIAMTIISHLWCLRITVIIKKRNSGWRGAELTASCARANCFLLRFRLGNRGPRFQAQGVEADKSRGVGLVVSPAALHRGDLRIVQALRAFPAGSDDVALVEFETNDAGDVPLR